VESEAMDELEERLAQGHDDAIIRVVDENTRGVVFAVHKGNVGNFK